MRGDDLMFLCKSSEPVTWVHDDYVKRAHSGGIDKEWPKFQPQITHSYESAENKFESTINLANIQYSFVGFYYCVKNASQYDEHTDLLKTKQGSRIYLFVEGIGLRYSIHSDYFTV